MNKKQTALLSVLVVVLIAIGILIFAFAADADGKIGIFVNYGIFLTVVTVLLTLLFSVLNIFKSPEALKQTLTAVAALVIILIISYLVADSSLVYDAAGKPFAGSEGSVSKWMGTSINYSIILLFISGGLFAWDMIKNAIK